MTILRYATVVSITTLAGAGASALDPAIFDAGHENRAGLVLAPDGDAVYWVEWNGEWGGDASSPRTIYSSRLKDGTWTEPAIVPFSGTFNDDDPYVSPDGEWLYFISDRPASDADTRRDGDIWRYSLSGEDTLQRLGINSDAAEYSPLVTGSGTLYFASNRDGGSGQGDLYRSVPDGSGFAPPEPVGPFVNSKSGEWNLWVSADDSEILFEASARPSNVSVPGDLYYSWWTPAGWVAAMPVSQVNSKGSDLLPRMHPDGKTLYYTSAAIGGHAKILSTAWEPIKRELRTAYAPTLLVANRSSHDVVFVDLAGGEVARRVATGEGPHLLSNVDDGKVMATGFGEFPEPHAEPVSERPPFRKVLNSRVTLLDAGTGSVLLETRLEGCARPHASWIVGNRGFVTCQDEQSVLEIDLETGDPVQRFDTRQQGSHVLAFDSGSRMLAASNTESGSVSLIDIDTGSVTVVELGGGSEGAVAADGRIWVANAWDGSVSVIDPHTATVRVHTERLCSFPIALSADQRNQVWVACFGSAELVAIDRSSYRETGRYSLDGQPLNILVHPERHLAYTSLPRENAVAEIDLESGAVLRRIPTGIEPDGLRWGR